MIKILLNYSLGLLTLIFSLVQTCEDIPEYDYQPHPNQPFNFEHVDLKATLEPSRSLVRGVVTYSVTAKVDGLTELILQSEESAIDDIHINEVEVDYRISEDSLIIQLPDSLISNKGFEVVITWQSNSKFGLYSDSDSNFWSSKNPLAHHHWFPVFDHPRNELTLDAVFTIPIETEVLFNGDLVGNTAVSETQKKIMYSSKTPVPVTGLGFALGDFVISEVTSGLTDIRLFSSENKFSEEKRIELVREASQIKKEVEKELSMEYPWDGLNVVVLPDNFWEERTHGSGTVFLYENLGSLSTQLRRGIYAQWFGEYQRKEKFFDFDRAEDALMRTALHFSVQEDPLYLENPDSISTINSWNNWQYSFKNETPLFQRTIKNSLSEILRSKKGVVQIEDYADVWYDKTGLSWFDTSPIEMGKKSKKTDEIVEYSLNAFYDEIDSNLELVFSLTEGNGENLYSIGMTEFTFEDSIMHEVDFTGDIDTVSFSLSPTTEYVTFTDGTIAVADIKFEEFPLYFLLNQLRSTNPESRRFAANLLSNYSDYPDLQLALNDVMSQETDPRVMAALLGTMATITHGATGTEQQFLDKLNGDELEIQLSSLQALINYPDNEVVKNSIRSKLLRTNVDEIFDTALNSYLKLASAEEIVSLAQRLQRVDSTGKKPIKVMSLSSFLDSSDVYVSIADDYLELNFSYPTQKSALDFLLKNDSNEERWISRLDVLLENRDPRIRFSALKGVKKLSPSEALKILNSVEIDEFDVRVLAQVNYFLKEISK